MFIKYANWTELDTQAVWVFRYSSIESSSRLKEEMNCQSQDTVALPPEK